MALGVALSPSQVRPSFATRQTPVPLRHKVGNRWVKIEVEAGGGSASLVVVDGPLRQPLADYLAHTGKNEAWTQVPVVQSALHALPARERVSFEEVFPKSRAEAMQLAVREAGARERFAQERLSAALRTRPSPSDASPGAAPAAVPVQHRASPTLPSRGQGSPLPVPNATTSQQRGYSSPSPPARGEYHRGRAVSPVSGSIQVRVVSQATLGRPSSPSPISLQTRPQSLQPQQVSRLVTPLQRRPDGSSSQLKPQSPAPGQPASAFRAAQTSPDPVRRAISLATASPGPSGQPSFKFRSPPPSLSSVRFSPLASTHSTQYPSPLQQPRSLGAEDRLQALNSASPLGPAGPMRVQGSQAPGVERASGSEGAGVAAVSKEQTAGALEEATAVATTSATTSELQAKEEPQQAEAAEAVNAADEPKAAKEAGLVPAAYPAANAVLKPEAAAASFRGLVPAPLPIAGHRTRIPGQSSPELLAKPMLLRGGRDTSPLPLSVTAKRTLTVWSQPSSPGHQFAPEKGLRTSMGTRSTPCLHAALSRPATAPTPTPSKWVTTSPQLGTRLLLASPQVTRMVSASSPLPVQTRQVRSSTQDLSRPFLSPTRLAL